MLRLIKETGVKKYCHSIEVNSSSEFLPALELKVCELLEQAKYNALKDKRKTLKAKDMEGL